MRNSLGWLAILGVVVCVAQEPKPTEGARELFFFGTAPKDALPPIPKTAAPAAKAPATPKAAPKALPKAPEVPPVSAALHLGIRYNLVLVQGQSETPVDPERNFKKGECVAVRLEANRSGYLYVLARESSGDWSPLFPTPELADQSNRLDPGQTVRTPSKGCFEIDDPPGTETLFLVLSRNPQDIGDLADSIKSPGEKPQLTNNMTQMASAERLNTAVEQINQEFGTRELPFKQVIKAPAPVKAAPKATDRKEPEHAVYVVSGSTKPAYTLVTKVAITHK